MRNVILGVSAAVAVALYPGVARADESGDWSGLKAVRAVAGVAAVKGFEVAAVPRRSVITPEQYRAYDPYRVEKELAAKMRKKNEPWLKAMAQANLVRVQAAQEAARAAAARRTATYSSSGWWYWCAW